MKIFIMWTSILTFLGCGQAISKNDNNNNIELTNKTEQYVSMDCQTGDITLTLNPDKTFNLTILFWDSKTNQHTGQETAKGNWTKHEKRLILITSDNNKIIYDSKTTNMKIGNNEINAMTYGFISKRTIMETQIVGRALAKRVMLGRPTGIGKSRLNEYEEEIFDLMKKGSQKQFIIKSYGVPSAEILHWLKKHELDNVEPEP